MENSNQDAANTFYTFKTIASYMNCFDPNDTNQLASFQSGSKIKIIIAIPGFATCNLATKDAFYKKPSAELMNYYSNQIKTLGDLDFDPTDTALANYSIENNIIYLDDLAPCPDSSISTPSLESPLDIQTSAMMGRGCPVECWASKYSLLGLFAQIQSRAASKDPDEKWIFSISWGTMSLCSLLKREMEIYKIDLGQDCDNINLGAPSSCSSPCALTNQAYINACEMILEDLTTNHNCIFFVSSGDTGPTSSTAEGQLINYAVDYPTSSKYVISAGGINYGEVAPSGQSTAVTSLVQSISKSAIGIATAMSADERSNSVPISTIGGIIEPLAVTGGGFSGYNSNDTIDIKARASQVPFLNDYQISTTFPEGYTNSLPWNSSSPQRGIPDISACMSNAIIAGWARSMKASTNPYNLLDMTKSDNSTEEDAFAMYNGDGTSLSSPLLAGFFAVLLSYQDLPKGVLLNDFLYAHPDCFDKPQTVGANTYSTINGFTSTTESKTWDPCVGLGTPNFLKLYNALKAS
jgi:hypothetical protein